MIHPAPSQHPGPSCWVPNTAWSLSDFCLRAHSSLCLEPPLANGWAPFAVQMWALAAAVGELPLHTNPGRSLVNHHRGLLPCSQGLGRSVLVQGKLIPSPQECLQSALFGFALLPSWLLLSLTPGLKFLTSLIFQQGNPLFWLPPKYLLKSNKSWF